MAQLRVWMKQLPLSILGLFLVSTAMFGQVWIEYVPADTPKSLPIPIDSNTASFWKNGRFHAYSSTSHPILNVFDTEFNLISSTAIKVDSDRHFPMWIESVYDDGNGRLFAWYHYEVIGVCPNSTYTSPEVGAMVSTDGGYTYKDLGIVLRSGDPINCQAKNGYFASGHGDFSVIVDPEKQFVYFLFSTYGGDVASQGIAMARMPLLYLSTPVGAAWKYYDGGWSEPGLGGRTTPIFAASVSWADWNTDAFWGPSVHWNTYLQSYVVLMSRSCCDVDWPQEGVYLTMNADLADPTGWTTPYKVVDEGDWYPWFQGTGEGETSSLSGQTMHLFLRQTSEWDIVFRMPGDIPLPEDPVEGEDGSVSAVPSTWILLPGTEKFTSPGAMFTGKSKVAP